MWARLGRPHDSMAGIENRNADPHKHTRFRRLIPLFLLLQFPSAVPSVPLPLPSDPSFPLHHLRVLVSSAQLPGFAHVPSNGAPSRKTVTQERALQAFSATQDHRKDAARLYLAALTYSTKDCDCLMWNLLQTAVSPLSHNDHFSRV